MKRPALLPLLLLAATCGLAAAGPVDELLKKGDQLDAQFKSTEAMAVFLEAEKLDPNNVEILCRLAKTHDEAMIDTGSKEEQKRLAEAALEYARRAAALNPKSAKAQLSMAITCGRPPTWTTEPRSPIPSWSRNTLKKPSPWSPPIRTPTTSSAPGTTRWPASARSCARW